MEMKISAKTHPKQIAGAIYNALQEQEQVVLTSIGAAALNNCTKALIIAKGFFAQHGEKVVYEPSFADATVPDKGEVVAIQWTVKRA